MELLRSPELLNRRTSRLLVIDVQERLFPTLREDDRKRLLTTLRFVCEGARLLAVPTTITEQYPQGLGATLPVIAEYVDDRPAKKRFSAAPCTGWPTAAEVTDDRYQIVVAGIETHVCVQQSVLDLLSMGYQTFVVADAVAARGQIDHDIALKRMSDAGAILTTAESVLFEWCETAEAAEFKQLSALVKAKSL